MGNAKVYTILVLIMFTWGLNFPWLKMIISYGDPLTIQAVRVFIAGVVIFIIIKFMRQPLMIENMPWKYILLGSLFGIFFHHSLFAIGIDQTSSMKAAIMGGMGPLFTAFVAVVFKDTVMTRTKFIGFALGASGVLVAIVKGFDDLTNWDIGDIYMFLSFFLQSFSFIAIRRATRVMQPMLLTAWMQVIGAAGLIVVALIISPKNFVVFTELPPSIWVLFLFSAVVATGIGHTLYNLCIQQIGAAESAIFANFSTIFALFSSALILNEVLTVQQFFGSMLVIIGVLVGTGNMERFIKWRHASSS